MALKGEEEREKWEGKGSRWRGNVIGIRIEANGSQRSDSNIYVDDVGQGPWETCVEYPQRCYPQNICDHCIIPSKQTERDFDLDLELDLESSQRESNW